MDRSVKTTLTNLCLIYDDTGHVEAGESMSVAAIREVFEATGLTVAELQLCGIKDWINEDGSRYLVLLYKTNNFIGKIKSSSEGKVFWTELRKLKLLKLADGMDELVKMFLQPNLNEQFLYQENSIWKSWTQ